MKIHGTAVGAALSKKDFGVAFTTSSTPPETEFCQEDSNTSKGFNENRTIAAEKIDSGHTLAGKTITSLSFFLLEETGVTGQTYTAKIIDLDGSTVIATIGTKSSADVSNTEREKITFSGTSGAVPSAGAYLSLLANANTINYAIDDREEESNGLFSYYEPDSSAWDDQTGEKLKYCAEYE